jgi:hypothetical protein
MQVAQTILAQIGGNNFLAMTGAKNLTHTDNSLTFHFPKNSPKNKIKIVKITLDADDTYTIKFYQYSARTFDCNCILETNGLYAADLKGKIERETGLALSL